MNPVRIAIAANRFGLGARPGDLQRIGQPENWLLDQLAGPPATPAELRDLPDTAAVLAEVGELRREQRAARRSGDELLRTYGRTVRRHYVAQAAARYCHAAVTSHPFHERLVHFFTNHFAVSADKQPVSAIAGLFENEAIRPHVNGSFRELLLAVERHPAMILYLDNQRSVGPNSTLGKRARRRRPNQAIGLNENLAREILELHTLGVDGGYSQEDVTSFARVLTGWSIGGSGDNGRFAEGAPGRFEFRETIHEPGTRRILGRSYPQPGIRQGEAVLRDLAAHPSTARFVSTKLARHFVADEPPGPLVDRLVRAWLESDGHLPTVCEALIRAPESWDESHRKYKSPHDFVVSTLRAFEHVPDRPQFIVGALDLLGQTPYRPGSPEGWPDTAAQWGGADALYRRVEWSNTVARAVGGRLDPAGLGDAVLGARFAAATRTAVARAESRVQGMTLFLGSPDFQRR
jgi:uncharacterized protein (DUF1800 family)